MGPSHRHAFNYCTPLIDGDDLLIVSRTSQDAANKHDNDRVTFHRLTNFRSLTMDLRPADGCRAEPCMSLPICR